MNGDVCFVTEGQFGLTAWVTDGGEPDMFAIAKFSAFRDYMETNLGEIKSNSNCRQSPSNTLAENHRYFEPQLLYGPNGPIIAYTQYASEDGDADGKYRFSLCMYDLKNRKDIVRIEGAQTLLFASLKNEQSNNYQERHSLQDLVILADVKINRDLPVGLTFYDMFIKTGDNDFKYGNATGTR